MSTFRLTVDKELAGLTPEERAARERALADRVRRVWNRMSCNQTIISPKERTHAPHATPPTEETS